MNLVTSAGLSLDQAPPLRLIMAFFMIAPLAIIAAGSLLFGTSHSIFLSPALPVTIALTHLGTLGFLASVMIGATYQLCPVLGGVRVPVLGLAKLVLVGMILGLVSMVWGLMTGSIMAVKLAAYTLPSAFLIFLIPAGIALFRAKSIHTILGMRLSLASIGIAVLLGAWLNLGFAGVVVPGIRRLWLQIHLSLGVLGWVGGLLMAVSWQLVPMFYLTPNINQKMTTISLWILGSSLLFTALLLPLESSGILITDLNSIGIMTMLPGALVVWVIHPISILYALRNRRRKRVDPSKNYWVIAMYTAPLILLSTMLTLWSTDLRWGLTCGWLAIWGWAGLVLHGMLTRIVPFLVWFHRFSHRIGEVGVPSVRRLYPADNARQELWLHEASVVLGVCAIWLQNTYIVMLLGILLMLTGLAMLRSMVKCLRWRV